MAAYSDSDLLRMLAGYFDDFELDEDCPWKYVQDVQGFLRRLADKLDEHHD